MRRPLLDDAASAYGIRESVIVMDPEHQQLEGLSLAPSPMSRQPSQGRNTVYFGHGSNETAQYTYNLQQKSADELRYPSPEGLASVTPYSTSDCSTALAGYENYICNNAYFPHSFVNLSMGPQHSISQDAGFPQCQQPSQQPGHEENLLAHSIYMGSHAFANGYPEFRSQESFTTGHPSSAVGVQASLQSPVSQPSHSPSTLGPFTPQW
jgi:hypothetical protein